MTEKNPWRVDDIVACTDLPHYTIRKFIRGEELLTAAKRMVRTKEPVPYYYRSAAQLLYSIALEVGLKALWEIDNGKKAEFTHDLSIFFEELQPDRREKHCCSYVLIANQAGSSVSLSTVLTMNANMVKDFKYGDYDGQAESVVGGEVVNDIVVGSKNVLISYGQFVIDDLESTIVEHIKSSGLDLPSSYH